MKEIKIFTAKNWKDYEMLDTGEGEKLERFGQYVFVRPYEEAVWKKTLDKKEWENADGKFWSSKTGAKAGWVFRKDSPRGNCEKKWEMSWGDVKFFASPTSFRHLSFFPEQASHWEFINEQISKAKKPVKFLNLFGYTGVASLVALQAGAEVTHVDASKQSIDLLKENQKLNSHLGFEDKPLRVIVDDVLKFLEREIKRGNTYDAVIMDPPKFGRGPKGETWKIEEMLPKLLENVAKILSEKPLFVILNSYAVDSSSLSLSYALEESLKSFGGKVAAGELCILEKSNSRAIPLSNTAIWQV